MLKQIDPQPVSKINIGHSVGQYCRARGCGVWQTRTRFDNTIYTNRRDTKVNKFKCVSTCGLCALIFAPLRRRRVCAWSAGSSSRRKSFYSRVCIGAWPNSRSTRRALSTCTSRTARRAPERRFERNCPQATFCCMARALLVLHARSSGSSYIVGVLVHSCRGGTYTGRCAEHHLAVAWSGGALRLFRRRDFNIWTNLTIFGR